MTSGRLLRKLIKAGAENGGEEFSKVAQEIINEERRKRHHLLANDLERILYGTCKNASKRPYWPVHQIPQDRERGLPLLEIKTPLRDFQDIVLSDVNKSVLEELLLEHNRSDLLASYGLKPLNRLLFCGPPGCGKTLAAEVIATELGLELALVRFDSVVSSFLGETSANLRKVFDFLNQHYFVALFDEFDSVGRTRDDSTEHGELKRVVNAFLQMMDGYNGRSILIAATNHERHLDRALWRRFSEVLVFERPNLEQIRQLLKVKLRGIRYELPLDDREFLNSFTGLTHSDIERVLLRAIKMMVLKGREFLTLSIVEEALRREEYRIISLSKM